jgi:hypothetical protein
MMGAGTVISIDCDHPFVAEIADYPVSGQRLRQWSTNSLPRNP